MRTLPACKDFPGGGSCFALALLLPACVHAEGVDTEHLFGFMTWQPMSAMWANASFKAETTGRFGSETAAGTRAIGRNSELEIVPVQNFRVEPREHVCVCT